MKGEDKVQTMQTSKQATASQQISSEVHDNKDIAKYLLKTPFVVIVKEENCEISVAKSLGNSQVLSLTWNS